MLRKIYLPINYQKFMKKKLMKKKKNLKNVANDLLKNIVKNQKLKFIKINKIQILIIK